MSTSDASLKSSNVHELPPSEPLNELAWQAWVLRGRAREERSRRAWRKSVGGLSVAGLLCAAAAGVWPVLLPYHAVIRFVVAAGAMLLMFRAFASRNYAFGALFGVLALLYNPVAAVFSFSGEWQRVLVVASALPFMASLTWRDARLVTNEQN
jgi:hypothetical protein